MSTLMSPQWRIFYLTLLVGLVTGSLTALITFALAGDPMRQGALFWVGMAVASVLIVGLPHYILFKVALRRQLGRFLRLFYPAIEQPVPKLDNPFVSREMDDLDALFGELLRQLREYIDRTVSRQVEVERLQRYFSPSVVEHLAASGGGAAADDVQKMHVTVLFTDIRGFTPMSARLAPDEVVEFLNAYFEVMIEAIYRERGTVLKLIGDAVMAVFGAPTAAADDTQRALRAGVAMQREFMQLQADWRARGKEPAVGMGVGINGGEVIVGNIGSPRHLDYTVIGDTVNVASRLTGVAKAGQVLVASATARGVVAPEGIELAEVGEVEVKGKDAPIAVCEARGVAVVAA